MAAERGRGPVDLADRVVVVAGGGGHVGGLVVRDLVARGARVLVPSRHPARLADLVASLAGAPGSVQTVRAGDAASDGLAAFAASAREIAAAGEQPSALVAALGGFTRGPGLLALPDDAWQAALAAHLTVHLAAAQAFVPLLHGPDPVHVTTNGAAADEPMPGSGTVNVTGAAQRMLLEVLAAEGARGVDGPSVRFHELTLTAAVAGDDRNVDPAEQVTPEQVTAAVRTLLAEPGAERLVRVTPRPPAPAG